MKLNFNSLIMNGLDLKKLLKINLLTHEKAAELFGVTRETVSRWCKMEEELPVKSQKNITSKLRENSLICSEIKQGDYGLVNNGNIENTSFDNRQYYSDSPDVLRAQIDLLDERIKEKDAQIKEKDAQIKELLSIVNNLSKNI